MAKNKKDNLFWGGAKIEFVALLPEIKELIYKEYPKTIIYKQLVENNKIKMSYRRFCELVFIHFPDKGRKKNINNIQLSHKEVEQNKVESNIEEKSNSISNENNANIQPDVIDANEVKNTTKKVKVVEIKKEEQFGKASSTDELKKLMGG